AYAKVEKGEVYLINAHIAPFELGNRFNHDPKRNRKLLLHKSEIRKLIGATQARGYTLIPLKMYFKKGKVKAELALAKGKLLYDKREALVKKTAQREMQKALRYKEKWI
ncbi:MAG: SsrA-binding protein SmpB, partial [Armatimonadetes bacterium]|nr:SsrA-binding protein SmpB [Armatimonadota bacterium]